MRPLGIGFGIALWACSSSDPNSSGPTSNAPISVDCAPGTMPGFRSTGCVPVGPAAVPSGFVRSSDGWGFSGIRPSALCEGATRAELGSPNCVPIGDCGASFPPSGTNVVVSASGPSDSTHAITLDEALQKVPAGGIVALDTGEYASVVIAKDVHLIGRCAAKVSIRGTSTKIIEVTNGTVELSGFTLQGSTGGITTAAAAPGDTVVTIHDVLITGNQLGLVAGWDARVSISNSVIEGPPLSLKSSTIGAIAVQKGAKLELDHLDIRNAVTAIQVADKDSSVTLRRSIIAGDRPSLGKGTILEVFAGASLRIEESVIQSETAKLALVGSRLPTQGIMPPGQLTIARSEITQRNFEISDGIAITATDAGALTLEDSSLTHQSAAGIGISNGASGIVRRSVFVGDPTRTPSRVGMMILHGAHLTVDGSALVNSQRIGLLIAHTGTQVDLTNSLIFRTFYREDGGDLARAGGQAIAISDGAAMTLTDSSLVANEGFGIYAGPDAIVKLRTSLIDGTHAGIPDGWGEGILIAGANLDLANSAIQHSSGAGLAFTSGSSVVADSAITDNAIGVHIVDDAAIIEANVVPDAPVAEHAVLVGNAFQRNGIRVANSPILLP